MRKPRTLLVTPRFVEKQGDFYNFPLGLAYISSALKRANFEVECLNLNHYDNPLKVLEAVVKQKDIDIVGTGAISPFFRQVNEIYETARQARPDIKTLGGGGIVSADPELMVNVLGLDWGIYGEGEETTVELLTAVSEGGDLSKVNGIAYRDHRQGKIFKNCARKVTKDLDALAWPDYDSFDIEHYIEQGLTTDFMHSYVYDEPREVPLIASRSCPFDCTFCYLPMGRTYRERTLDGFFQEIDFLVSRYKVNIFTIYDDLFAVKKDRLIEFCARIKKYNVGWMSQLRVNVVDPEILRMMKDAGCYYISYGLESASPTILKSMKKKITVENIEATVAATKAARIGFQGNFLFGDTNDTWDTVMESVDWYRRNPEYQILLIPVGAYPGSEIYQKAIDDGVIDDKEAFIRAGSPLINISRLTGAEYQNMLHLLVKTTNDLRLVPEVLSKKRQPGLNRGRVVYELKIRCPHCREEMVYKNARLQPHTFTLTGCRCCHGRFWLPPIYTSAVRFLIPSYIKARYQQYGLRKMLVKGFALAVSKLGTLFGRKLQRGDVEQWIDPLLPNFPSRAISRRV